MRRATAPTSAASKQKIDTSTQSNNADAKKPYICSGCKSDCHNPSELDLHLCGYREFGSDKSSSICLTPDLTQCKELFDFPHSVFKCTERGCNQIRRSKAGLNAHLRLHRYNKLLQRLGLPEFQFIKNNDGKLPHVPIPCHLCDQKIVNNNLDYWFATEDDFGTHIEQHHADKIFQGDLKCPHIDDPGPNKCTKSFHTREHLRQHIINDHGSVIWKCNFGKTIQKADCDFELKIGEKMTKVTSHIDKKHNTFACFCKSHSTLKFRDASQFRRHFNNNHSDLQPSSQVKKYNQSIVDSLILRNNKLTHVRAMEDPERIHRVPGDDFIPLDDFSRAVGTSASKQAKTAQKDEMMSSDEETDEEDSDEEDSDEEDSDEEDTDEENADEVGDEDSIQNSEFVKERELRERMERIFARSQGNYRSPAENNFEEDSRKIADLIQRESDKKLIKFLQEVEGDRKATTLAKKIVNDWKFEALLLGMNESSYMTTGVWQKMLQEMEITLEQLKCLYRCGFSVKEYLNSKEKLVQDFCKTDEFGNKYKVPKETHYRYRQVVVGYKIRLVRFKLINLEKLRHVAVRRDREDNEINS